MLLHSHVCTQDREAGILHHRFKTAEAAWSQEKAQYRHEAEAQKKKAHKLQLEYEKLQVQLQHHVLCAACSDMHKAQAQAQRTVELFVVQS